MGINEVQILCHGLVRTDIKFIGQFSCETSTHTKFYWSI